jgi:ABC-type phosphate transport system substrate-binding protein
MRKCLPLAASPLHPVSLLLLALTLTLGCQRAETPKPTPAPVRIRVAADDAALPLVRRLGETYAAQEGNDNIYIIVNAARMNEVPDLLYGVQADLAAVSHVPTKGQNRPDFWLGDLAIDGVAMIVNAQNPVNSMTLQDIRDIFSGVRGEWGDFGIPGRGVITVLVREDSDGTRIAFDRVVMGPIALTRSAVMLPSIESVVNYVALQPDGVGYVPSSYTHQLPNTVKVIGIEDQLPTSQAIAGGHYRLVRTINLISLREPQGDLRKFVAWALGPEAQKIVAELNYVPVGALR